LPVPHTIIFSTSHPDRFGVPSLAPVVGRDVTLAADAQGLTGVTLAANVSEDFQVTGTLTYDTAETAAAFVTKIEEQLTQKLEQMGESSSPSPSSQPAGSNGEQFGAAQETLLRSLSVSQSDAQVNVKLTIPGFFVGHSLATWSTFAGNLFPDAFAPQAAP
jgi:hypothetical protein